MHCMYKDLNTNDTNTNTNLEPFHYSSHINHPAKLIYLNFHRREVVSRG